MDIPAKLTDLEDRYELVKGRFERDKKQEELKNLEAQTQAPDFWQDSPKAQSVMKKISTLDEEINTFDQIEKELYDLSAMVDLAGSDPQIEKELGS